MPTSKETLEKAYGSIPKEVGFQLEFPIRGLKYYWLKLIRRIR
jgi:hypothetical protein